MKNIHLCRFHAARRGNHYEIFLGNGYTIRFNSKRSAVSFMGKTNKYLTSLLVQFNSIRRDVTDRYEKNWLLLWHDKASVTSQLHLDSVKCWSDLNEVHFLLDHSFWRAASENGSSWVFINYQKIADYLKEVCSILTVYHTRRSETADLWELKNLVKQLDLMKNDLSLYGFKDSIGVYRASQGVIPFKTKIAVA